MRDYVSAKRKVESQYLQMGWAKNGLATVAYPAALVNGMLEHPFGCAISIVMPVSAYGR
jgi:hypothetical protein